MTLQQAIPPPKKVVRMRVRMKLTNLILVKSRTLTPWQQSETWKLSIRMMLLHRPHVRHLLNHGIARHWTPMTTTMV